MVNKWIIIFTISIILSIGLIQSNVFSQSLVPEWIKNNAKWWGEGLISEQDYLNSIKYLLENNIIKLSESKNSITQYNQEDLELEPDDIITSTKFVTKPILRECVNLHEPYLELGEKKFLFFNKHLKFIKDCIKLYNDPIWDTEDEHWLDKLSEKLSELRAQAKAESVANPLDEARINILSLTNIGTEKYMVKFNGCAGNQTLDKAAFLIESDIESIHIGSNKDIPTNSCRTYEAQIYAKHQNNIQVSLIEEIFQLP